MDFEVYRPYNDQPDQCVVLDISGMESSLLKTVCNSLSANLRLNLLSGSGYSRIPRFLLCTWSGYTFEICCHSKVITNMDKAISNLKTIECRNVHPTESQSKKFLSDLVALVLHDLDGKKKADLTFCSRSDLFCCAIVDLLKISDINSLVSSAFEQVMMYHLTDLTTPPSMNNASDFIGNGNLVVLVRSICCHSITFDVLFRQWLLDKSLDHAAVQISLPSLSGKGILCDIRETWIPPNSVDISRPATVPIKKLKSIYRLPISKFCHEMLYGIPLVVVPSKCWKLDWDEVRQNDKTFQILCRSLTEQKEILLLEHDASREASGYIPVDPFHAFFPGETSAIISPVVFREIILPVRRNIIENCESNGEVKHHLDALLPIPCYNPLLHAPRSGVVDRLLQSKI